MKLTLQSRFAVLFAMQRKLGYGKVFAAQNQAPTSKNGGRPMFKQNRRQQMALNNRRKSK